MSEILQLLEQTLNPSTARDAERQLKTLEKNQSFPIDLLRVSSSNEAPLPLRQAASLCFKNLIKRRWVDAEGNHLFNPNDVQAIKEEIIPLMITQPQRLQAQLGEAISIIADSDFPDRWPDLVPMLVSRLNDNPETIHGVLVVAHSIFKRWRPLIKSDELFTEIKLVLGQFCQPYLGVMEMAQKAIISHPPQDVLLQWLKVTNVLIKIFYDLNCQDIPEFFEDHIGEFMTILNNNLKYTNPAISCMSEDDEIGVLEEIKTGVCEAIQLYAQRYEEEMGVNWLSDFVRGVWELLVSIGLERRYDLLVNRALGFLTTVAELPRHAPMFQGNGALAQIVEKIVIPNMTMRTSDEELFEDDPIEFIRRDLEGSDSDTRRRASTDFLRALASQMEPETTQMVMQYVDEYLKIYNQDPKTNWRYKNTAAYLFSSIAAKGKFTASGVSNVNLLVDLIGFFQTNIAPELMGSNAGVQPILQTDAIRFIHNFRNQLTKEQLTQVLPLFVQLLSTDNYVVYTYAAITIERILGIRRNGQLLFTKLDLQGEAEGLIGGLMQLILRHQESPEKLSENEFLIKCIMRILITTQSGIEPFAASLLTELIKIMQCTASNPSNPLFTHYLFESIGAILKYAGSSFSDVQKDQTLVNPMLEVLGADVSEFVPYVLQILAKNLTTYPKAQLSQSYQQLVRPLLSPALWEARGNAPAITSLLEAILVVDGNFFAQQQLVSALLGVFQNLIASKANDQYGFSLLEYILTCIPHNYLDEMLKQVAQLLLLRLQSSRTDRFVSRFARFIYFLAAADSSSTGLGPDFAVRFLDQVQDGVFGQVMRAFLLPNTAKISGQLDRRIGAIGLTKLICGSSELLTGKYTEQWLPAVEALVRLLETNISEKLQDVVEDFDVDEISFGGTFSRLSTTTNSPLDPVPTITNAPQFAATEVSALLKKPELGIAARFAGLSDNCKIYLHSIGLTN